uniref:BHLH domain-containing protein n=1 Tax=Eptatretus burgeri TaxID=7764 RepID=A0A8C4PZC6_EPTBU
MFSPPVNSGKNRPTTLGSSQFSGSGVDGRTNGSSWSSGSHSSPTYDSPRAFPDTFENRVTERGQPSQDTVPSSQFINPPLLDKTSEQDSYQYTREAGVSSCHQGLLQSELDLPNPRPLSSPTKPASPYYFSGSNRRRHLPDSGTQEVQSKKVRKVPPGLPSSVYTSSTSQDEYGRDSEPAFTQAKPPAAMFSGTYFMQDGSHPSSDLWPSASNGPSHSNYGGLVAPSATHVVQAPGYGGVNVHDRLAYNTRSASPNELPTGLPPMSTFHRGPPPDTNYAAVSSRAPSVNGTDAVLATRSTITSGPSQTGDALGKALASIYSPDHTNNSFSSNASTPVDSPPPLTTVAPAQWQRSSSQDPPSPGYENSLHTLQSRMEERLDRLDDAIHVMRNHAVGPAPGLAVSPAEGLVTTSHNGPMGAMGTSYCAPGLNLASRHSSLGGASNREDSAIMHGAPGALVTSAVPTSSTANELSPPLDSYRAVAIVDATPPSAATPGSSTELKSDDGDKDGSSGEFELPDEKKMEEEHKLGSRSSSVGALSPGSNPDDEDLTPEQKVERERDRRMANNARERLRVRDINEAFKELGRMCQLHLNTEKPQTKLLILHQAVTVILSLEQQVRERNLNPKAACLKRREEEKVSAGAGADRSSSLTASHPISHQGLDAPNPLGHL